MKRFDQKSCYSARDIYRKIRVPAGWTHWSPSPTV
jgi:hypothetical protein